MITLLVPRMQLYLLKEGELDKKQQLVRYAWFLKHYGCVKKASTVRHLSQTPIEK
jgi:hypothetical protein